MEIVQKQSPVCQFPQSSEKEEEIEIKNLEELVQPYLKNNEYVKHFFFDFYKPGIFVGGAMLEVEIQVKDKRGRNELIYYFSKPIRPRDPVWEMFDYRESFEGEVALYKTIIPALTEFVRGKIDEKIIDIFVKFVGARSSLDPKSDVVDRDAVLLLEDPRGDSNIYFGKEYYTGFDSERAEFVLQKMAQLHATVVGYKLSYPDHFKDTILPKLKKENPLRLNRDFLEVVRKRTLQACWRNPLCKPYMAKIEEALDIETLPPLYCAEPFATMVLNDFWTNNLWMKEKDGEPTGMTFLDCRSVQYGSPGHDFIFFMYTSVSLRVIEERFYSLATHYYNHFWWTLKKLGCNTDLFERADFIDECLFAAKKRELAHLLIMLSVIFMPPEKVSKLPDFDIETYLGGRLHHKYYKRIPFLVLDFVRHKYL